MPLEPSPNAERWVLPTGATPKRKRRKDNVCPQNKSRSRPQALVQGKVGRYPHRQTMRQKEGRKARCPLLSPVSPRVLENAEDRQRDVLVREAQENPREKISRPTCRKATPGLIYSKKKKEMMSPSDCPWCGQWTRYEQVRGHYECQSCHRPVADCCDGEQIQDDSIRQNP